MSLDNSTSYFCRGNLAFRRLYVKRFAVRYNSLSMNAERNQEQKNAMQPEIPLSDQVLIYARQGWPVFPLAGKIPYEGTNGHKAATKDEAVLTQAWNEHPKANIGLATGKVSGVIVLDMDVPEGYYALKALQEQYE